MALLQILDMSDKRFIQITAKIRVPILYITILVIRCVYVSLLLCVSLIRMCMSLCVSVCVLVCVAVCVCLCDV